MEYIRCVPLDRESLCLQEELLPPQHPQIRETREAHAKVVTGEGTNRTTGNFKVTVPGASPGYRLAVDWCSPRRTVGANSDSSPDNDVRLTR